MGEELAGHVCHSVVQGYNGGPDAGNGRVGWPGDGIVSEPTGQSKYVVGTRRMGGGKDDLVCHQTGQNEDVLLNLVLSLFRNATL